MRFHFVVFDPKTQLRIQHTIKAPSRNIAETLLQKRYPAREYFADRIANPRAPEEHWAARHTIDRDFNET